VAVNQRVLSALSSALFIVFFLVLLKPAYACSCVPQPQLLDTAVRQAFNQANAVVLATVSAIQVRKKPDAADTYYLESQVTRFATTRRWKGDPGATFETDIVTACCICGMVFEVGERYLLYLSGPDSNGRFSTSICSRSRLSRGLDEEIEILDRLQKKAQ
jgi:hypothetical protein